jgi:hypothetical protein
LAIVSAGRDSTIINTGLGRVGVRVAAAAGLATFAVVGLPQAGTAIGSPFGVTLSKACVLPGDTETITVNTDWMMILNIVVTDSSHTKLTLTSVPASSYIQVATWTIPANAQPGDATILFTGVESPSNPTIAGVSSVTATVPIGVIGQPCTPPPSLGPITGVFVSGPAAADPLKLVCDQGVSGTGTFSLFLTVPQNGAAFALPSTMNVSVPCNGVATSLPGLSTGVQLTLHEVAVPSGGVAAADATVTMTPADLYGTPGPTVTIHNAAPTPPPTPSRAPTPSPTATPTPTGTPSPTPSPSLSPTPTPSSSLSPSASTQHLPASGGGPSPRVVLVVGGVGLLAAVSLLAVLRRRLLG